jgi:hypothetical protein
MESTGTDGRLDRSLVYARRDGIVARQVANQTILVPLQGAVWGWLDGETPLGAIADRLLQVYQVDKQVAEADLAELVGGLEQAGLIHRTAR